MLERFLDQRRNGAIRVESGAEVESTGKGFGALVLFGVGLEYLLDRNLALTFKIKLGPAINSSAAINSGTDLFFTSQIGIALKL